MKAPGNIVLAQKRRPQVSLEEQVSISCKICSARDNDLHEKDGRNGTEQERTTTDERHVVGVELVEVHRLHEDGHVVGAMSCQRIIQSRDGL